MEAEPGTNPTLIEARGNYIRASLWDGLLAHDGRISRLSFQTDIEGGQYVARAGPTRTRRPMLRVRTMLLDTVYTRKRNVFAKSAKC